MMELVIGGSGSGKSAYAETAVCRRRRFLSEGINREVPLYYIADMTIGKCARVKGLKRSSGT